MESRRGNRHAADGSSYKDALVEVGVEIGLMTIVESKFKDGKFDLEDLEERVKERVIDLFDIDDKDTVLNNICIYGVQ